MNKYFWKSLLEFEGIKVAQEIHMSLGWIKKINLILYDGFYCFQFELFLLMQLLELSFFSSGLKKINVFEYY